MSSPEDKSQLFVEPIIHKQNHSEVFLKTLKHSAFVLLLVGGMAWSMALVLRQNNDIQNRLNALDEHRGVSNVFELEMQELEQQLSADELNILAMDKETLELIKVANETDSKTSKEFEQTLESLLKAKNRYRRSGGHCLCQSQKGPPGDKGAEGPKGGDGNPGSPGTPGPPGPPGPKGMDGEDGMPGTPGGPGHDGAKGPPGKPGPPGAPGPNGRDGKDGEPGNPGKKGRMGPKGKMGKPGRNGRPGRPGVQGPQGFPGPTGARGGPGEQGVEGPPGTDGNPGLPGAPGDKGADGDPGKPGGKGPAGEPGEKGDRGAKGPMGDQGHPGSAGPPGPPGQKNEKKYGNDDDVYGKYDPYGDDSKIKYAPAPAAYKPRPKKTKHRQSAPYDNTYDGLMTYDHGGWKK